MVCLIKNSPIKSGKDQLEIPIINAQATLDIMERNYITNPVVSLAAINLLAEILQHDQGMSAIVLQYFEKPAAYKILVELLSPSKKQTTRTEEIRKIEGSSFGCPVYGFNDAVVNLL